MLTPTPNPLHDVHEQTFNFQLSTFWNAARSSPLLRHGVLERPWLRQAFGAVVGAMIALVIYQGFAWVTPHMQNLFAGTQEEQQQAVTAETQEAKLDRVAAMAAEKMKGMQTAAPEDGE